MFPPWPTAITTHTSVVKPLWFVSHWSNISPSRSLYPIMLGIATICWCHCWCQHVVDKWFYPWSGEWGRLRRTGLVYAKLRECIIMVGKAIKCTVHLSIFTVSLFTTIIDNEERAVEGPFQFRLVLHGIVACSWWEYYPGKVVQHRPWRVFPNIDGASHNMQQSLRSWARERAGNRLRRQCLAAALL